MRLSRYKSAFERAYDQKWTDEIFTITTRSVRQGIPLYTVKGWKNDPILGKFQEQELNKVHFDSSSYEVESIRKETIKNEMGYYIKWKGWSDPYNTWINHQDFVGMKEKGNIVDSISPDSEESTQKT